jgi:hypothetical protein
MMFASTFKRTHRLVLGYLLGQVRSSTRSTTPTSVRTLGWQPRGLGIIQVSRSCGNGAPSTLENHESLRSSITKIIVVSLDLHGLVYNSCNCLVICNKDVSTRNGNPGLVMTRGVNFWDIVSRPRHQTPTRMAPTRSAPTNGETSKRKAAAGATSTAPPSNR